MNLTFRLTGRNKSLTEIERGRRNQLGRGAPEQKQREVEKQMVVQSREKCEEDDGERDAERQEEEKY